MAQTLSPYGLRPVALVGGQSFAGSTRDFKLSTNNTNAIFVGDVIQLSAAGNPAAVTATPVAATPGIVGICMGVRYTSPGLKQPLHAQWLPAGAIAAGYTDVSIIVADDPDTLFYVQGSAAFGTLTNGPAGAVGKNAAIGNFGGNQATGNSTVNLVVGVNGAGLAATPTLGVRIIGVPPEAALDPFPNLIVKFNFGVHSYYFATGV